MNRSRRSVVLAGLMLLPGITALAQNESATDCNAQAKDAVISVSVPGRPFGTVLTADGCWMFISMDSPNPRQSGGVAVFERAGNSRITLRRVVPIPNGVAGLVMTHDGKLLIGAAGEFVVFFDIGKLTAGNQDPLVGYMTDGRNAGSVYVNVTPDDHFLFVSDESDNTITVTDLSKARSTAFSEKAIVGKIAVGGAPIALTFSPDARLLYTTSEAGLKNWKWRDKCSPEGGSPVLGRIKYAEGAVIVVDVEKATTTPDKAVMARVPAGCSPVRLALGERGERVWVTVRSDNLVAGFDTRKLVAEPKKARVATVPVGKSPVGVSPIGAGRFLVVTNSDRFAKVANKAQSFVIIDTRPVQGSPRVVATLPAGEFPREFAQSADGNSLFLTNFRSSSIQVIDVSRLPVGDADGVVRIR